MHKSLLLLLLFFFSPNVKRQEFHIFEKPVLDTHFFLNVLQKLFNKLRVLKVRVREL